MKTFGQIVREARLSKGYTQEQLADIVGYSSRSTIAKIESGERDPKNSFLPKLIETLDIPIVEALSSLHWGEEAEMFDKLMLTIDEKKGSQSETLETLNKISALLSEEQKQNVVNYAEFLLKNSSNA